MSVPSISLAEKQKSKYFVIIFRRSQKKQNTYTTYIHVCISWRFEYQSRSQQQIRAELRPNPRRCLKVLLDSLGARLALGHFHYKWQFQLVLVTYIGLSACLSIVDWWAEQVYMLRTARKILTDMYVYIYPLWSTGEQAQHCGPLYKAATSLGQPSINQSFCIEFLYRLAQSYFTL